MSGSVRKVTTSLILLMHLQHDAMPLNLAKLGTDSTRDIDGILCEQVARGIDNQVVRILEVR